MTSASFCSKIQVLAKAFTIVLSSRKQFRTDYEQAFMSTGWEATNTKTTEVELGALPAFG